MFQKLLRITGVALHLEQVLQPVIGQGLRPTALAGVLIQPVRGNASLGDPLHVMGADLHLDRRTMGAEQHRV